MYMGTQNIQLAVFKYKPPRGGKYFKTPSWILNKKAVINIKNYQDDLCFIYSIIAALLHRDGWDMKNRNDPRLYKEHFNMVDFKGISMPISLEDVRKFEKRNNLGKPPKNYKFYDNLSKGG